MARGSAGATLSGTEDLYRLLVEASPLPTWVLDGTTGRFLLANAAATAVFGYSNSEFLSLSVATLRASDGDEPPRDLARDGSCAGRTAK